MLKKLLFSGPGASTRLGDFGLALARFSVGAMMFLGHGYGKLLGDGFGPGDQFIADVRSMHLPAPTVMAWIATLTESVAAILLALGLLTRPMALLLTINMAVAAFIAHGGDPWFMGKGASKEPALLYLIPFALFLFTGGGRFALDTLFRKGGKKPPAPIKA